MNIQPIDEESLRLNTKTASLVISEMGNGDILVALNLPEHQKCKTIVARQITPTQIVIVPLKKGY